MVKQDGWPYGLGFLLCVMLGFALAVVFSVAALVIYLVRAGEPFEVNEVSLTSAVVGYFVGFLSAGVVGGALNPLAKTKFGAMLVGILSTIPMAFTALFVLEGTVIPQNGAHTFAVLFVALGFGGPIGYMAWKEFVAPRAP